MRSVRFLVPLLFLVACSDDNDNKVTDAGPSGGIDAPSGGSDAASVDAPAGSITVSGTATEQVISGTPKPAANIVVAAYANSNETTPVATTKADANGHFSLTVNTGGAALDGYLKASSDTTNAPTSAQYVDTYLYQPVPLTASFDGAAINMLTPGLFAAVAGIGGFDPSTQGLVALEVVDSIIAQTPIAGAKITSTPAATKYGYTSGGLPSPVDPANDNGTAADGRGFFFGLTPGQVVVNATKAGLTFKPTTLKVRANAFTTTLITE
jgi:hypothetical protein